LRRAARRGAGFRRGSGLNSASCCGPCRPDAALPDLASSSPGQPDDTGNPSWRRCVGTTCIGHSKEPRMTHLTRKMTVCCGLAGVLALSAAAPSLAQVVVDPYYGGAYGLPGLYGMAGPYGYVAP